MEKTKAIKLSDKQKEVIKCLRDGGQLIMAVPMIGQIHFILYSKDEQPVKCNKALILDLFYGNEEQQPKYLETGKTEDIIPYLLHVLPNGGGYALTELGKTINID